jgi:hypothetical protein
MWGRIEMGNLTIKGWYTSSDEIPLPVGVVLGRNLRKPSPTPEPKQDPAPFGLDVSGIAQWIADQEH